MRDVSRPAVGFYSCEAGQFFVCKSRLVFELLDDPDLDGPEEVLVALLPPDAEPMSERFLLPSLPLRLAARLGLFVPAPLRAAGAADVLDEIHWRAGEDGSSDVADQDHDVVAVLAAAAFVEITGGRATLGRKALQVLDELIRELCGSPGADTGVAA
jgi:hypothetical protein